MKEKRILIMILGIIAAILIIIAAIVISKIKEEKRISFENENTYKPVTTVEKVKYRNKYYAVQNIVQSYIDTLLMQDSETLYNILNPSYIEEFNLSEEQAIQNLYKVHELDENEVTLIIENMYIVEISANLNVYFVYGYIRNNVTEKAIDFKIMVEIDSLNKGYYITPTDGFENLKYDSLQEGQEIDISNFKEIEANEYNIFDGFVNISDETVITDYLSRYKEYITYNKQKAYDVLNKEYREKRFGSFEEFEKNLNDNIMRLYTAFIDKYAVSKDENTEITQYIGVDEYNNFYIFNEKAVMDFELMLDIYTIPLNENIETYELANEQEKVAMNINKWVMALNTRDYKYMYNVLNESFKQNNIPTLEAFTEFVKNTFFESNKLEFVVYNVEATTHIYEINLVNRDNEEESLAMTIMMKLNDDNSYEMSFEME